jgi:hypothetical protein
MLVGMLDIYRCRAVCLLDRVAEKSGTTDEDVVLVAIRRELVSKVDGLGHSIAAGLVALEMVEVRRESVRVFLGRHCQIHGVADRDRLMAELVEDDNLAVR